MKRPNITPGKWKKRTANGKTIICREDSQTVGVPLDVCRVWQSSFTEANARAIAAVPALMAALDELLATHELRGLKGETFTPLQIRAADAAKAALIEAGYTF
jgi:hypothetical protein